MPPRKNSKNATAHKKPRRRTTSQNADYRGANKGKDGSCPIVGIGGSAGGFELATLDRYAICHRRLEMAFVIGARPQFTLQQSIAKGCSAN